MGGAMIRIEIPGRETLVLEHLVSDVNGTLAVDGQLLPDVASRIEALREVLQIHLLTADTHGKQAEIDRALGLEAVRVRPGQESEQKAAYVRRLGAARVIALGQGANDAGMLAAAALGICVLSLEGTAVETLLAADIVAPDVATALDLLLHPKRLTASLRK